MDIRKFGPADFQRVMELWAEHMGSRARAVQIGATMAEEAVEVMRSMNFFRTRVGSKWDNDTTIQLGAHDDGTVFACEIPRRKAEQQPYADFVAAVAAM